MLHSGSLGKTETKVLSSVAGINDQAHTIFTMRRTPMPGKSRKSASRARLELTRTEVLLKVCKIFSSQSYNLQTTEQRAHVRCGIPETPYCS